MWPQPIVVEISQDHWKVKSGGYSRCSKDALTVLVGEENSNVIALTEERHGLVEVDHYPRIEESTRSRKWL